MSEIIVPGTKVTSYCILPNDCNELLIVRRNENLEYSPGLWEFPGGDGLDPDETPNNAFRRLAQEETGLEVESVDPFAFIENTFIIDNGKYEGRIQAIVHGIGKIIGGSIERGQKYSDHKFVLPRELSNSDVTAQTRKAAHALAARLI